MLEMIGRFLLGVIFSVIAYFVCATIFGGFAALVTWNWLILKDAWMFWTAPTYIGLRITNWFLAIIAGFSAVFGDEAIV